MGRPFRWTEVEQLSEATSIPALPMESPRGVNDPWLHQATNCLSKADLVLLVGKKLDFSLRFGAAALFLRRSAASSRLMPIRRSYVPESPAVQTIHAEPTGMVRQLTAAAQTLEDLTKGRTARFLAGGGYGSTKGYPRRMGSSYAVSAEQPIHPLRICEAFQPFLDDGAVFVSDGGEFGQWVQAGLEAEHRLINGPAGSIGSAIPDGTCGEASTSATTLSFVFLGDGTFGYHAMEFDTALRYNLPIIAVIGNDARWNAEHQLQIQNYGEERTVGCDLLPSRYDKMIEALGGHGEFVQHPDDLTSAVERALASGLPACINVAIESVSAPTFR